MCRRFPLNGLQRRCERGYIYTHGCQGPGDRHAWTHVSTLLWTPLFCCVSHRGVNTQMHSDSYKHKEGKWLYSVSYTSVLNLYVGEKNCVALPISLLICYQISYCYKGGDIVCCTDCTAPWRKCFISYRNKALFKLLI